MATLRRSISDPAIDNGGPSALYRQETDPMIEMEEQGAAAAAADEHVMDTVASVKNPPDQAIKESKAYPDLSTTANEPHKCYKNLGQGALEDFNGTVKTWWVAEMSNLSLKTFAVGFFLFFACIAPAMYVFRCYYCVAMMLIVV